jgi:hypothetical protein
VVGVFILVQTRHDGITRGLQNRIKELNKILKSILILN